MYYRLSKKKDFEKVAKKGHLFFGHEISIKLLKNDLKYNRYGIVTSLKLDKRAVVRNKVRRQIRDIIKQQENSLKQGFDLMVLTNEKLKKLKFTDIKNKISQLFIKSGLL